MNKAVIPAKAGIQDHPVILSGAKNLVALKNEILQSLRSFRMTFGAKPRVAKRISKMSKQDK
jgi:hypothetical protein